MQRKETAKEVGKAMAKEELGLPEVNFSDYGDVRFLHLGTEWVQGSMLRDAPYDIELEYVQRMMAGLLFTDAAAVSKKHAMQLGLGSAALTKFCYKKLRMKTTAIEINPQVITACRLWFKLPRDDLRLHVIQADAAAEIKKAAHQETVDLLHVDLYDHEAAAPVLDSADFYEDCRGLLTEDGVMTVNLFGRDSSYLQSLTKIAEAFGPARAHASRARRTVAAGRCHRIALGPAGQKVAEVVQACGLGTCRGILPCFQSA
jgi:spermidine synthase